MSSTKIHSNRAYHVYNRGVSKQKIFKKDADYKYFIFRIAYYKLKYKINIVIFCVMPNHYHFLFDVGNKPRNVALFMQCIQHTYSCYFNREHNHVGHVFQGRYKRRTIKSEADFKYVFNYIRTNPVKDGLVKKPEDWPYMEY